MAGTLLKRELEISRRAGVLAGIRGTGIGLGVAVSFVLGRLLGVSGYGAYAAAMGLAQMLSVITGFGASPLVVRSAALYIADDQPALLRGLIRRSVQTALVSSVLLGGCTSLLFLVGASGSAIAGATAAAGLLVPFLTLTMLGQSILQGFGRVIAAFGPLAIGRPVGMGVALAGLAIGGASVSATGAVLMQAAVLAIVVCLLTVLIRRRLPPSSRAVRPAYAHREWASSAVALWLTSSLTVVGTSVGVVLTGAFGGAADAGLLGASASISIAVSLLPWAAMDALQPIAARLSAAGRLGELQQVVTKTTRQVAVAAGVVGAGVAVFAGPLLSIFGGGFSQGVTTLRLLCLAGAISAVAGPNVTLLMMTHHDRAAVFAAAGGVLVTAALCVLLVPWLGAAGGAAAYVMGTLTRNGLGSRMTLTRLGIDATIVGAPRDQVRLQVS